MHLHPHPGGSGESQVPCMEPATWGPQRRGVSVLLQLNSVSPRTAWVAQLGQPPHRPGPAYRRQGQMGHRCGGGKGPPSPGLREATNARRLEPGLLSAGRPLTFLGLSAPTCQIGPRATPACSIIQVSCVGAGTSTRGLPSATIPGATAGSWKGSAAGVIQNGTLMWVPMPLMAAQQ